MPIVAYDPATQAATDEKGRQFSIAPADVPNAASLPTRAQWMTGSDIQTPTTGTASAPASAPATLAKLDNIHAKLPATSKPAPRGPAQLPVQSTDNTRSVQKGLTPEQTAPFVQASVAADETAATGAVAKGQGDTQRAQQTIQTRAAGDVQSGLQASARQQLSAEQAAADDRAVQLAIAEKDPEIDPNRFIKSMGAGKSLLMLVLAGITGAADAVLGKQGENGVVAVLNRRIEQDIEAQKQQIADGKVQRGNRIAFWREKGFNDRQAESAARIEMNTHLAAIAEGQAAMIGTPEAAQNGQLLAEQIRAAGEVSRQGWLVANATDRVSEGTSVHREAPKAAAAGSGLENFTKQLAARKAYEEAGATPEQLAAFDTALGVPSPGGKSSTALGREADATKAATSTEDQAKALAAWNSVQALGDAIGLEKAGGGKFKEPTGISSRINIPEFTESVGSVVGSSTPIKNARKVATDAIGRLQSGGVISGDEEASFKTMLGEASSKKQVADVLNRIQVIVEPRMKPADAKGVKSKPTPVSGVINVPGQ